MLLYALFLAHMVAEVTGFSGRIEFDASKPDGTMRKLMDVTRLSRMGWTARIDLGEGLKRTYDWFVANEGQFRA